MLLFVASGLAICSLCFGRNVAGKRSLIADEATALARGRSQLAEDPLTSSGCRQRSAVKDERKRSSAYSVLKFNVKT